MAKIISVEKPRYLEKHLEIHSKIRVGEYSKFLDKAPAFVTYYHINQTLSVQDVGTGNIESETGDRSPIRFNKITNFPIYNLPELKPDVIYDEAGYDIELDCSDLVILPGTLKPSSGDYFIISIPGAKEYLFRVNNFKYNTILSNDFYIIDADIKRIGVNLEAEELSTQIVEEYYTVFDNIGTKDRCFLKNSDIDYINNLANLFFKLRDTYKNRFYEPLLNTFTIETDRVDLCGNEIYRYDPYLEAFISKSNIYYDINTEATLVLSPACILERRFDLIFNQTLYRAVLDRSVESLWVYQYELLYPNYKKYDIFSHIGVTSEVVTLRCEREPVDGRAVKKWSKITECPECISIDKMGMADEYFPSEFITQIKNGHIDTDNYLELIICEYMNRSKFTIDRTLVMEAILDLDQKVFYYLPLVIYILNSLYNEYFSVDNADLEYLT